MRSPVAVSALLAVLAAFALSACSAAPSAVRRQSPLPAPAAAPATRTPLPAAAPPVLPSAGASSGQAGQGGYSLAGGAHCGALSTKRIEGGAKVEGGKQHLVIGTKAGYFDPNEITLRAGMPTRVVFDGKSTCIQGIAFTEIGIRATLADGPRPVMLPALRPGTYTLSCSHNMAFARIYVKAG